MYVLLYHILIVQDTHHYGNNVHIWDIHIWNLSTYDIQPIKTQEIFQWNSLWISKENVLKYRLFMNLI